MPNEKGGGIQSSPHFKIISHAKTQRRKVKTALSAISYFLVILGALASLRDPEFRP
jgi:hypothetical protein